jgi:hypothetical protein
MRQDFTRAVDVAARIERVQSDRGRSDPTAYQGLGTLAFFRGDIDGAHRVAEEWVGAARAADDGFQLSHALVLWASTEYFLGVPTARAHMEEAVSVARETGTLSALSLALSQLVGFLDVGGEDSAAALALAEEAIEVASKLDDPVAIGIATSSQALTLAMCEDNLAAIAAIQRGVSVIRRTNNVSALPPLLGAAVLAVTALGDYRTAAVLDGARGQHMVALTDRLKRRLESAEARMLAALGDEYQPLVDRGAAMSPTELASVIEEVSVP